MPRIYCEGCQEFTEMGIVSVTNKDSKIDPMPRPFDWGDICCSECSFVIATIEADIPGQYIMTQHKRRDIANKFNRI